MTVLGWQVESRLSPWLSRVGRTRANVSVLVCGLKGRSHTGRVGGVAGGFSASPLSREVTLREVGESVACRMSRVLAGVCRVFGFPVGRKVHNMLVCREVSRVGFARGGGLRR